MGVDHGEHVELKCSTNAGASWELMKKYTDRIKFEKWETVSEQLPFGKVCNGNNVLFKLTQKKYSCSTCDNWAIDSLLIKTMTASSSPLWAKLSAPRGTKGETGMKGNDGQKGERGERGATGVDGQKGERGERGVAGMQGPHGPQGIQGPRGLQGNDGQKGERGERGVTGMQGPQGEKGNDGLGLHLKTFSIGSSYSIGDYVISSDENGQNAMHIAETNFVATDVPAKESKKKVLSHVKKGWDFDTSNSTFGLVIKSGTLKNKFKNTHGSALYFNGHGVREVRTSSGFDTRNGGSITFKMIYGNGFNGGERVDHGEYVELKCSTNAGASWELMKKYTDRIKFEKWETVSEQLPFGKVCNGNNVLFKLTQKKHSCLTCDEWAIDSLLVKTMTVSSSPLWAKLSAPRGTKGETGIQGIDGQ